MSKGFYNIPIAINEPVKEYRKANGFECLIGYLYIINETSRFEHLMNKLEVVEHIESIFNEIIC